MADTAVTRPDQPEGEITSLAEGPGPDLPSLELTEPPLQLKLSTSSLLLVLQGVAVATKASANYVRSAAEWLTSGDSAEGDQSTDFLDGNVRDQSFSTVLFTLRELCESLGRIAAPVVVRQLASITVAVAFLVEASRKELEVTPSDLDIVWRLVSTAATSPDQTQPICTVSRSAQGFLAIPLCSIVREGNIDKLFRLHVWIPDRQRGNPNFAIHSHQPFAQSWVLAGVGTDCRYEVQTVTEDCFATHAEYALAWSDGRTQSTSYKTHQVSSTVENTYKLVHAKLTRSDRHTRDETYTIPAGTFHATEVEPETLHATLFLFDSRRGFLQDARILGPKDMKSSSQIRDPGDMTAESLARVVEIVRSHEQHMRQGQHHSEWAELEYAIKEYDSALNIIESANVPTSLAYYRQQTLGAYGVANRRFGRYQIAKNYLEQALEDMGSCHARVNISGELAVVYRHMGLLKEAQGAAQIEYDTALQLNFLPGMSRALGTLGMVNYQLFQRNGDRSLLDLAIKQLMERVESARSITESMRIPGEDRKTLVQKAKSSIKREFIGLSRLSLCYTAQNDLAKAQAAALQSLNLTYELDDPTDMAMSHFFYGRTLLRGGNKEEAVNNFNSSDRCSPAVMLCQEPSEEHREYLQELISAGGDIDLADEQGYTALDYTIFSGDEKACEIILGSLRCVLRGDVELKLHQRLQLAKIRKAYRELFQDHLRPLLLKRGEQLFQTLRISYAKRLAANEGLRKLYDNFKFVWYSDFRKFGRLPRSSDALTNNFIADGEGDYSAMPEFVIFFSYRWINQGSNVSSPDDSHNTQYQRMIAGLEEFLKIHSKTSHEKLGIWMVGQCI